MKALVVLGRVVRLTRRVPALVAACGPPLIAWPHESCCPWHSRSCALLAVFAWPYAPEAGRGGVVGCAGAAARSWGKRTSENFRRAAASSCPKDCRSGSSSAFGQKYQMASYRRAS